MRYHGAVCFACCLCQSASAFLSPSRLVANHHKQLADTSRVADTALSRETSPSNSPSQSSSISDSPPLSPGGDSSIPAPTFAPFLNRRKRAGLFFDEEINFCFSEGGPNPGVNAFMTRRVNVFANHAAKKILIGVDSCFQDEAERVKRSLAADYGASYAEEVQAACAFVDAVTALSPCSNLSALSTKSPLTPFYTKAHDRVTDTLLSAGCATTQPTTTTTAQPNTYSETAGKVIPQDRDFCLSLYDTLTFLPTKTKALNTISNRVARTLLYGGEGDISRLIAELESDREEFLQRWMEGNSASVEALYYNSLLAQLAHGLEAPTPELRGGYGNAYQRLQTMLLQELGTRPAPVNGEVFASFVRWEASLRRNLTASVWNAHPRELCGQWTLYEGKKKAAVEVGPVIAFRRDGTLRLPLDFGLDGSWSFEPGPTHLDTIHFKVRLHDGRRLDYTGYVDRGQRIESRFSRRPIFMMGRVIVRSITGEPVSSAKFQMTLERRKALVRRGPRSKSNRM